MLRLLQTFAEMAAADDLRPLDAAIDEIRTLHVAAEHAATRIASVVDDLTAGEGGTNGLVADVAEALVGRTEAIREECERLTAVLQRARAAIAAEGAPAPRAPIPAEGAPGPRAPIADIAPEPRYAAPRYEQPLYAPAPPQPVQQASPTPARPAPWAFWRRKRAGEEPSRIVEQPPRLPRPDYAAMGVGPVIRPDAPSRAPARPVPEGVRLIATQMAIAGSSRVEIERRLQRQFGIGDASVALDEIFGNDSSMPIP